MGLKQSYTFHFLGLLLRPEDEDLVPAFFWLFDCLRAAAHQLRQDNHQDMRQKTQPCFIRDSDSSPHTEVARVCVLSHLL
jgi:hypothetical protein